MIVESTTLFDCMGRLSEEYRDFLVNVNVTIVSRSKGKSDHYIGGSIKLYLSHSHEVKKC